MYFSPAAIALVVLAGQACAAPTVEKRVANKVTDADILNYALTLEHLENTFYRQGLKSFSAKDFASAGYDATFYQNVKKIAGDEKAHVGFLTKALKAAGATPVKACTYDFGVKNVKSFLATASVLEGVGVSAYLGAAASIMNRSYLTAAGSILTVESRHSSYIRQGLKQAPFAQAFDAPLDLNEVYSLAAKFIKKCPDGNPKLPVKAFPSLELAPGTAAIKTGTKVTLLTPGKTFKGPVYAGFIAVTGPTIVAATPVKGGFSVVVPKGFEGQTYVVLTDCETVVTDDTVLAGPAILEVRFSHPIGLPT